MNSIISVVMSVYNAEKYLKESIESILNQTFKNFEFIIINDGSTDRSLEIIENYAKKDDRIVVISRENRGLITSLNEGIEKAKGKYIVRMDADDISLPNRCKKQIEFMEKNSDIAISGSAAIVFRDDKESLWRVYEDEKMIKAELLFSSPFIHPSVIMRRDLICKYNLLYDKSYIHAEDLELWNRMSRYGLKMANINKPLLKYRDTPNSVTKQANKNELKRYKTILSIFKKNLENLNISNAEKENRLHYYLTVNHRIKDNNMDRKELFDYFEKIINANREKKVYDEMALKKVLGRRWLFYIYYKKDAKAFLNKYFVYGLFGVRK